MQAARSIPAAAAAAPAAAPAPAAAAAVPTTTVDSDATLFTYLFPTACLRAWSMIKPFIRFNQAKLNFRTLSRGKCT